MWATLVRHGFIDRPDWIIVSETVPLGTRYKVVSPVKRKGIILNTLTNEKREVDCYLIEGNGSKGMMVADVLEITED